MYLPVVTRLFQVASTITSTWRGTTSISIFGRQTRFCKTDPLKFADRVMVAVSTNPFLLHAKAVSNSGESIEPRGGPTAVNVLILPDSSVILGDGSGRKESPSSSSIETWIVRTSTPAHVFSTS